MIATTDTVRVTLPNGAEILVQARQVGGKQQVGVTSFLFSEFEKSVEGIADALTTMVKKVKPQKASVEFGIEASIESGKLVGLLCSGDATANLKITLEWNEPEK